jgi:hypothetical protein
MKNKERSQEKIKELLDKDSLVISTNQIVIPIACLEGILDSVVFAKIGLTALAAYNAKHNLAPIATKSIKASLTKDNAYKIIDKYDLSCNYNLYINIYDAQTIINSSESDEWKTILDYADLFKSFAIMYESPQDYFYRKKVFFKYMPMFHSFALAKKEVDDIYMTYCCEDCDGEYEQALLSTIEYSDKSNIFGKLKKLKIKSK